MSVCESVCVNMSEIQAHKSKCNYVRQASVYLPVYHCFLLHGSIPTAATIVDSILALPFSFHCYLPLLSHSFTLSLTLTLSLPQSSTLTLSLSLTLTLSHLYSFTLSIFHSHSFTFTYPHSLTPLLFHSLTFSSSTKMNEKHWESECIRAQSEAARHLSNLEMARSDIMYVRTVRMNSVRAFKHVHVPLSLLITSSFSCPCLFSYP